VTFGAEHQVTTLNTTSINGGLNLNGGLRSNSFPHMAVNPVSGDLIVVWNDDPAPAGGADRGDVFYSRSLNNGTTWSAPVKINDDGARDQFTPTVAISPSGGEVMFGYYSRSHDPANLMFHRRIRPALMNVATGAITKRHSAQLSPDTPIVIGQDPVINATYMGDYDVIAANDSTFFSSWADNRASSTAHAFQPDVYLARVARTAPSTNTNVGVTVTPNPSTLDEGDTTTLAVKATAIGHSARDVYISLAPANGLNYSSTTGGGGCKIVNGFVGCSLGTIGAGATAQRNVIATATSAGSRTATAKVTTTDNDTNQGNNTGSGTVTVNSVPKVTETYSTGNIAVAIPDTSTVDVPLAIGPNSTLFDVNASVRLNHTFDSDLAISLVSPGGGTVIDLSSNNGGSGDNYGSGSNNCAGTPTVFDQQAATAVTAGLAPFAGSFMPEQSLAGVNGLPSGGTWNLRVADQAAADVGTIGCFVLKIRRAAP
jgi:subtilisin-like proprotein convertase family protein